jgi:hypothetical protein
MLSLNLEINHCQILTPHVFLHLFEVMHRSSRIGAYYEVILKTIIIVFSGQGIWQEFVLRFEE